MTETTFAFLTSAIAITGLIFQFGVCLWLYWKTRLRALGVFIAWMVLERIIDHIHQQYLHHYVRSLIFTHIKHFGQLKLGPALVAWPLIEPVVGKVIFVWMLIALVQWVPPTTKDLSRTMVPYPAPEVPTGD